jgi:intein/homing endonuclease
MYNNRYSVATPAQSYVTQNSSNGGFFGGLVGGVAGAFCFVAGTIIATPFGGINIEDIKAGDIVYTLDMNDNIIEGKVAWVQEPIISGDDYITIATDKGSVKTTASQPFLSENGFIRADNISIGDKLVVIWDNVATVEKIIIHDEKEVVYDLSVEGRNIYFADGFAVEGRMD